MLIYSILGEGPTQGLDGTKLVLNCRKKSSVNFTENNKFSLSLHSNGTNDYLFVNGTKIIKFNAKDSEIVVMFWKHFKRLFSR